MIAYEFSLARAVETLGEPDLVMCGLQAIDGDGCTLCGACEQICPVNAITIERVVKDIDLTRYSGVWVVAETEGAQRVKNVTFELLGKGRELAGSIGQTVSCVLLGNNVAGLCRHAYQSRRRHGIHRRIGSAFPLHG